MTDLIVRPAEAGTPAPPSAPTPAPTGRDAPRTPPARTARREAPPAALPLTPRRVALVVVAWLVVTLVGIVLVLHQVGPLLEQRDQRALLGEYRTDIRQAASEAFGLPGTEVPTQAVPVGAPVGIVDINRTELRQVAVEGAGPQQTRRGPGHLAGSAGLGQPGNSVLVGRRTLFGGPFRTLGDLRAGDRILVTTTQGRSVYEVGHVGRHQLVETLGDEATADRPATEATGEAPSGDPGTATGDPTDDGEDAAEASDGAEPEALLPRGPLTLDELYGPSEDDRLTLVTSASGAPWASEEALVVVARMDGLPFAPTPQGGRTSDGDGRGGDPSATAPLLLALLAYAAVVTAAAVSYRRVPWRSAYVLSAPPLVALTIVLAEQLARTLPAWS